MMVKGQVTEEFKVQESTKNVGSVNTIMAAPANDNCVNATVLTIGAALTCGQTTNESTLQTGECYTDYSGGSSENTVWYRFTSTNDSLVLNILRTNTSNCVAPHVAVYGPFASGAGCIPCGSIIYNVLQSGDPGRHILLTGLATTGNRDYLIQVQGNECGGSGDRFVDFCINLTNPANNSNINVASLINQCGVTFNGTTNGGYWATGTSVGFNNLDGNNSTTATGASEAGDDVTFVINNISWFKFCTVNAGTYNVQFDVISCIFTGVNSGSQMAILTGTNTSLTNVWQASNPTYPATAVQTSPNFTLAAGECGYLVVDGFAGDACSYSYVLTNVAGGCVILPIELISFTGESYVDYNLIKWVTASEINNDYFTIERSLDGINFITLNNVDGAGTSTSIRNYSLSDYQPNDITYYRLRQTDFNGDNKTSEIIAVTRSNNGKDLKVIRICNIMGQEVTEDYDGIKVYYFNDGSIVKKYKIIER